MYTAIKYEERVATWQRMVRLRTFTPKAFSRTGWWMLQELQRCGYIDVTPLGWRIARGTACMPREVDPAHWWQRAAWCALRWYPGADLDGKVGAAVGAPVRHLCMRRFARPCTLAARAMATIRPDTRLEPFAGRFLVRKHVGQLHQGYTVAVRFSRCFIHDLPRLF